ncbi:hypothetical protein [Branchiibius cervicis]|uniref:Uncharacterized protein n=1 Tax=Branchiibius cervicis TaxID=908252 RepID=A0ABW2AX91_9MICO
MTGHEMHRVLPFPYEAGRFPFDLGAVVQNTVLRGEEPAREVGHTADGEWFIGDGVNDPNLPGASTATHIWHAIERDSSIADLATMPPGHRASRPSAAEHWQVQTLDGWGG